MFQSETREQLRKLPDEHVTTYDRDAREADRQVRAGPTDFRDAARWSSKPSEGDSSDPADRKFGIWRWCPAKR